jgi:spore maturation protein SpmA
MNAVFVILLALAFGTAAYRQFSWDGSGAGPMETVAAEMIAAAGQSVTLAIGLIGVMALFLGLMKIGEAGGLLAMIARLVRPLMVRLFPGVPHDHPAMGAIVMNVSANVLGLGNAATPFGIRAMQELDKLNPQKGTATDAMVMFLAINTANVTVLPTSIIALRAASGSADPAGIVATTLFATVVSTAVAILAARLFARFSPVGPASTPVSARAAAPEPAAAPARTEDDWPDATPSFDMTKASAVRPAPLWASLLVFAAVLALIPLTLTFGKAISPWIIPGLAVLLVGFGVARGVRCYEAFVEGAKDGFTIAVRIIPYLVAILFVIAMLRASGALAWLIAPLGAVTEPLGLPAEGLTMALMRALSGSGSYGYLASLFKDPAIGPDSYIGYLASTIAGSTETTFYVIVVYFGAIGVRRMRHALAAGLTADLAGLIAAVAACAYLFSS